MSTPPKRKENPLGALVRVPEPLENDPVARHCANLVSEEKLREITDYTDLTRRYGDRRRRTEPFHILFRPPASDLRSGRIFTLLNTPSTAEIEANGHRLHFVFLRNRAFNYRHIGPLHADHRVLLFPASGTLMAQNDQGGSVMLNPGHAHSFTPKTGRRFMTHSWWAGFICFPEKADLIPHDSF